MGPGGGKNPPRDGTPKLDIPVARVAQDATEFLEEAATALAEKLANALVADDYDLAHTLVVEALSAD